VTKREIKPPSSAELAGLLRRAGEDSPDLACYVMLAAATGARRSEVVALRWNDIDLADGRVYIGRGVVAGTDGLVEKDTTTHAARKVALDARTLASVADHLGRMRERGEFFDIKLAVDAFVFSNEVDGSKSWYPDTVTRKFKRVCEKENLSEARLHDLRHFVATELLSAGVDVRTVAGRLGQRNAATTLKVYAHFLESADRQAADVIGRVIADGDGSRENSGD
jgi:integrase